MEVMFSKEAIWSKQTNDDARMWKHVPAHD